VLQPESEETIADWSREKDRQRERETDRERERERERDKETDRERDRERDKEIDRERDRERQTERETDRERERERERETACKPGDGVVKLLDSSSNLCHSDRTQRRCLPDLDCLLQIPAERER
jgi:hypothetical protein